MERATRDEVNSQLSAAQDQLHQTQQRRQSESREREGLRARAEECEGELERVREEGRRAEEVCRQRETELGRVQALLHSLETDNREQVQYTVSCVWFILLQCTYIHMFHSDSKKHTRYYCTHTSDFNFFTKHIVYCF